MHAAAYDRAARADIVITNHALLLSKEWGGDSDLAPQRVIVDEAHKLEDAATAADTDEVSEQTIARLLRQLSDERSGQGLLIRLKVTVRSNRGQDMLTRALGIRSRLEQRARVIAEPLQRYCELNGRPWNPSYGVKLRLYVNPGRTNPTSWEPVAVDCDTLIAGLGELAALLEEMRDILFQTPLTEYQKETAEQLTYLAGELRRQAEELERLLRVSYDPRKRVHWIDLSANGGPKATSWAIKCAPVRVGGLLAERLYDHTSSLVLTSATLGTTRDQGFAFAIDRLGLEGRLNTENAIALPHPFDYRRALFVVARYLDHDARPSEAEQFEEEISQELYRFCLFGGGNALCLFTARRRMMKAFEAIRGDLGAHGIPVGMQGADGSRRALLEEIKDRPGSVVLGLKSFWEGVDVPGPNLRFVTIDKLPFPVFADPVIGARSDEIRARGGHDFTDYILPLMLTDFRQGFGRLIRDEHDLGVVLLLDKRVWHKDYFSDLIGALPGDVDMNRGVSRPPTEVLLSRKRVYQAIIDHLRDAPPEWGIDFREMEARLEQVPDRLVLGLALRLANIRVPDGASLEDPEIWDKVVAGLAEFGHKDWRNQEQEESVRAMLRGQDALIVLPTGTGKSLTFQLPALLSEGTTVVFSPLKALMKDQVDKLADKGLPVADRLDSSQSPEEQEHVFERLRSGHTHLLYVAPERIRDPRLRAALRDTPKIARAVVDEAHCLYEWGQTFRPDFLHITQLVDELSERAGRRIPIAALTATATPAVRAAIAERLNLAEGFTKIERSPDRPELNFVVYNQNTYGAYQIGSQPDKLRVLLRILHCADRAGQSAVVYTNTTWQAERLVELIRRSGLDARCYHGKMDDQERREMQDMFLDGQVNMVVATKAFGLGIDKPDIRYVIHYELPANVEAYFQEAGRAGRDGQPSYCILLYHPADLDVHEKFFIRQSVPDRGQLEALHRQLTNMFSSEQTQMLFVDGGELAGQIGMEQDQLGRCLHLLEERNVIRRGVDVTLAASCRLLVPMDEIAIQVQEVGNQSSVRDAVINILERCVCQTTRVELRTIQEAQREGVSPLDADDLLYRLASKGLIIYRAFARALSLQRGDSCNALVSWADLGAVQREMTDKLEQMRRYAESKPQDFCYRRYLLECLEVHDRAVARDHCCAHCSPREPYPWLDVDVTADFTDPDRYLNVRYTVLQALAWNASLPASHGRPPYGWPQLKRLLLGNDYVKARTGDDRQTTSRRRLALTRSEFFGRLQGLHRGETRLEEEICALRGTGLVETITYNGEVAYEYDAPTQIGTCQLAEGRVRDE